LSWLDEVVSDDIKRELKASSISVKGRFSSLCIYCRGGRNLCGKTICPITLKALSMVKVSKPIESNFVQGSSPPSVFVGHFGYPKVSVGPMVPSMIGDTYIMDLPEQWMGTSVETIVDYRYSLLRGKVQTNVTEANTGNRLLETLQELSMSIKPVDSEVEFLKRPLGTIYLDDNSQPFGPSAPLKSFKLSNVSSDRMIERFYYDNDMKSQNAIIELYEYGRQVSKIQRAFSVGMFGLKKNRRLVPTRWSITAVDSTISSNLVKKLKNYETIDKFQVYGYVYMDNIYAALLIPQKWSFEWMEAWFPGTFWNMNLPQADVGGDYESYWGRTTYPGIGGCYYACRLSTAEALDKMKRQATALVLREIHPEFPLPLGVWFVRECVREMFKKKPSIYENMESAIKGLRKVLTVPLIRWFNKSEILKNSILQKKITDF
jgi:hypothetical protein